MNPYTVLGLTPSASDEDIKKAYRKLAMIYHPDRAGGDETKFKEAQAAYDKISNAPQSNAGFSDAKPPTSHSSQAYYSWDEFLQAHAPRNDFMDSPQTRNVGQNSDILVNHSIDLTTAFTGTQVSVKYTDQMNSRTVILTIPPGISDLQRIKIPAGGSQRNPHKPNGDLYVAIHVKNPVNWERKGVDLYHTVDVSVLDLLGGGTCDITTIDGVHLSVPIRSGTSVQSVIRIPEKGMPTVNQRTARGDMFLILNPLIPKQISPEALILIQQLKQLFS